MMTARKTLVAALAATALAASACRGGGAAADSCPADTIRLRHARNLTLVSTEAGLKAIVRNPWDTTRTLATYLLTERGRQGSGSPDAVRIGTPVRRAVVYSSVHCHMMAMLGCAQAVAGVCDLGYNLNDFVQRGCADGTVADCGRSAEPSVETIVDLGPDLIMLSPYENAGGYGRVGAAGIPILECADYMETSALGRAEWIRFYGRLLGCADRADSLFEAIERRYLRLSRLALSDPERPVMFTGMRYGQAWYVSGGNSTVGRLFADAGLSYVFAGRQTAGADAMSFESVLDAAAHADLWFITYNQPTDKTYAEIEAEYAPYALFDAFGKRHIWGCNTSRSRYFEETSFEPDALLHDLIVVAHPHLLPNDTTLYFKPLR